MSKNKILFLCEGNSCRSQMAEGLFNHKNTKIRAYSGGLKPVGKINPHAIKVMDEIGINISKQTSKGIPSDLSSFYIFVLCGCSQSCPNLKGLSFYNTYIEDPSIKIHDIENYQIARKQIETIIDDIIYCFNSCDIETELKNKFKMDKLL